MPSHKIKSTYVNHHDVPSITLQAICNANKKFIDVFTCISSKIHDARVFRMSHISDNINIICGNDFYLFIRDYGNLTHGQKNFNYTLAATRIKIENAFGLLKQRFRELIRTEFESVDTASKFIIASYVLHHLCSDGNDEWDGVEDGDNFAKQENTDGRTQDMYNEGQSVQDHEEGELKRYHLCEIINI